MSPAERYRLARALFHEARSIDDPAKRSAFVAERTEGADTLRAQVEELLRAHEEMGGGVETAPDPQMRRAAERAWEDASQHGGDQTLPERIGPYAIRGLLGRGGMATVYRALQERPEREVALKVLAYGTADDTAVARFRQEAQLLGRLKHDGIAQIYEYGRAATAEGERIYIAMELVEGKTLLEYADEEALDTEARVALLLQVLDAVAHAHRASVVHRDLKPSNVVVNQRGDAKLLDFGVARVLDESGGMTRTGEVVGTLLYLSPEQVSGSLGVVDTRSDVYSLGAMAYELLSGKACRNRETSVARVLEAIAKDDVAPLYSVAPQLPSDLCLIVDTALERDAGRRYPTADAFADDLRRWQRSEPVRARPPTWTYQFKKYVARNKLPVGALAAVLLALSVGLVLALRSGAREHRERERADRRAADALRTTASLRIKSAHEALAKDRVASAREHLAEVPEAHRTWAWHYVHAQTDHAVARLPVPKLVERWDGAQAVRAVVVDLGDDGKLTAADESHVIEPTEYEAWYATSRQLATPVLVRHGGQQVALLRTRHLLRVNNDGKWPQKLRTPARDGLSSFEAWTGGTSLGLIDLETGTRTDVLRGHRPLAIALHPSKPILVVGTEDNDIEFVDLARREALPQVVPRRMAVTGVAWSGDGSRFASIDSAGTLEIYRWPGLERISRMASLAQDVSHLAFAAGGEIVIGLGSTHVHAWRVLREAPSRLRPPTPEGREEFVYAVDVSPDGRRVLACTWHGAAAQFCAQTGRMLAASHVRRPLTDVQYFDGGRKLLATTKSGFTTLDADTGVTLHRCNAALRCRRAALRPEGRSVVAVGKGRGEFVEWTLDDKPPRRFDVPAGSDDISKIRRRWGFEIGMTHVDGLFVHAADFVRWAVCDLERGANRLVVDLPPDEMLLPDLVTSPDGRMLIAAGPRNLVTAFDLATGERRQTLRGHADQVFCIALHPDGRILASGSHDGTVRIWDLAGGEELLTLTGHARYVHDVAFSPDGRTLYSASGDGTVGIWSAVPRIERKRLADEEIARSKRLRPKIEAHVHFNSAPETVVRWIRSGEFSRDPAEQATALALVLEAAAARAAPK